MASVLAIPEVTVAGARSCCLRCFSSSLPLSGSLVLLSLQKIDDEAAADGANSDPILACPATLGDLTDAARSYGGVGPAAMLVSYKSSEKMPGTKVGRQAPVRGRQGIWRL